MEKFKVKLIPFLVHLIFSLSAVAVCAIIVFGWRWRIISYYSLGGINTRSLLDACNFYPK